LDGTVTLWDATDLSAGAEWHFVRTVLVLLAGTVPDFVLSRPHRAGARGHRDAAEIHLGLTRKGADSANRETGSAQLGHAGLHATGNCDSRPQFGR